MDPAHPDRADCLSALLERFPLEVDAFHAGPLRGEQVHDPLQRPAHFHLVRNGRVVIDAPGRPPQAVTRAGAIYVGDAGAHRLHAGEGAEVVSAVVRFGACAGPTVVGTPPPALVVEADGAALLLRLVTPLFDEALAARTGRRPVIDLLCGTAVVAVLRHAVAAGLLRGGMLAGLQDARLAPALLAVQAEPQRDWTLDAQAAKAGMSRARYAAAFRRVVGLTPGAHLTACRLTRALEGLRQGMPPKQAARLAGYGSAGSLMRALAREGAHGAVLRETRGSD